MFGQTHRPTYLRKFSQVTNVWTNRQANILAKTFVFASNKQTEKGENSNLRSSMAEVNKCTETREIEGELDGVKETKDEHTHTRR